MGGRVFFNRFWPKSLSCLMGVVATGAAIAVPPDTPPNSNTGNRYTLERAYLGEISAAESYLRSVLEMGDPLVILDVRDETEHALGHPEFSESAPYPRIYRDCIDDARTEDGACANGTVPGSTILQTPAGFFC